jgi:hypothetical protein
MLSSFLIESSMYTTFSLNLHFEFEERLRAFRFFLVSLNDCNAIHVHHGQESKMDEWVVNPDMIK